MSYNDMVVSVTLALVLAGSRCFRALLRRMNVMSKAHPRFTRQNPPLPPAVANLFELTLMGSIEGQQTINTLYYWDSGAVLTATSELDLGAQFITSLGTHYRACHSSDWAWIAVKVQCLTSPTRIPALVTGGVGAGTGPAGHEPTQVGTVMARYSGVKGQAGRGRFTMPAVPTAWVTASSLTTLTAYNTFSGDVETNLTVGAITYVPQLVSRKNKGGPPLGASKLLLCGPRTVLGTIRRRKLGKGS